MATSVPSSHLPVFFFHGLTGNPGEAVNLERVLTANGRALVALSFCPSERSVLALRKQIPMAIAQIREVVAGDERFQNGYVFIGHSQGGMMARAVIEEMDDHQVHTLISMAGAQNGVFYGPQPEDAAPMQGLLSLSGFSMQPFPTAIFDFGTYQDESDPTSLRGKVQRAFAQLGLDQPELHEQFSFINLGWFPARETWLASNPFLPMINNVNKCEPGDVQALEDKERRKRNFLKLKAAHFFASPGDGVAAPWQNSVFGRYSEVDSLDEIVTKFESLKMLDMRETEEYQGDTFGLKTLEERGGLFIQVVPDVPHCGWITDGPLVDDPTKTCEFQDVFDKYILPALP